MSSRHPHAKLAGQVYSLLAAGEVSLVDVREPDEFLTEHVAGSENVPLMRLSARLDTLVVGLPVVFACATGRRSALAAAAARRAGLDAYFVLGGLRDWRHERLPLVGGAPAEGVLGRERTAQETWRWRQEVELIDVRSPAAFLTTRVPGSRNIPLKQLGSAVEHLEEEGKPVIFVCRNGRQSEIAASLVASRDRIPSEFVAGGLLAWAAAGLPLERPGNGGWAA